MSTSGISKKEHELNLIRYIYPRRSLLNGSNPTKLGKWTWVKIEGEGKARLEKQPCLCQCQHIYYPCKSTKMNVLIILNQQVQHFKREQQIEEPDIHTMFITDIC